MECFDFAFDDFREAGGGRSSARTIAEIDFVPSEGVTYSRTGAFAFDDADGRMTRLEVGLIDFTQSTSSIFSLQESTTTPLESFVPRQ